MSEQPAFTEQRDPVIILGRKIGTCNGWDQGGDWAIQFNYFVSEISEIPSCPYLIFDMETGLLEAYNEDGEAKRLDAVTVLSSVPRS